MLDYIFVEKLNTQGIVFTNKKKNQYWAFSQKKIWNTNGNPGVNFKIIETLNI